jgi:prephenate dehydrogenase
MKIGIVGLGLIGGTYAKNLKKYPYEIYGIDISQEVIDYAIANDIIDYGTTEPLTFLHELDVVFLCLYPQTTIEFIHNHINHFKRDAVISDVVGIKRKIFDVIEMYQNDEVEFVLTHPIAGREKIGIKHSDEAIFHNANFVITPTKFNREESLNLVETLAKQMGFKNVSRITDIAHDNIIAYTSQLTHAIAISLVNSDDLAFDTSLFIGDSYKDLTRIAMINEQLWAELFIYNKDFLIKRITNFEKELSNLKQAIEQKDVEKIKEIMVSSTIKRGNIK